MNFGTEAQFGDLITLRDGLIHIHAAVYDPTLLKSTKRIRVRVNTTDNTLEVAEGEFVANQMINFIGDATGLTNEKFYAIKSVSGPLSNIITLYDPTDATKAVINITTVGTNNFIEPNVPFVFPDVYQKGSPPEAPTFRRPDGMFPYLYVEENSNLSRDGNDSLSVGYINTAIDTTISSEVLRDQIDDLNLAYNNWIKQNVDPRYYGVYEYRVPRSRFSTDKLNGQEDEKVVYSDVATGEVGTTISKVRPGETVIVGGQALTRSSVWDIDLTKVTMLKVEFSWYGAVGALFLAYVPVGNGEARWVRVHHLRASNQLKISSLGNATLPITYVTYGGGTVDKLGIDYDGRFDSTYGDGQSDHVVKYGASYYIDGGDRGTVRLYSHTNLIPNDTQGRIFELGSVTVTPDTLLPNSLPYITVAANTASLPYDNTFFMKSEVVTSSIQDQNVQVVWVDDDKLYLSKDLVSSSGVKLITKRPAITFGLKAKDAIFNSEGVGIRNRVQVYPTKLSVANFSNAPMSLEIIKNPIFQSTSVTTGAFTLDESYPITSNNDPLSASNTSIDYLSSDDEEVFGWFVADVGTVFGRLYRQAGLYYFELKDVFTGPVNLFSGPDYPFLKDGRFDPLGDEISTENFEVSSQKERLSSVRISNVTQVPIPDTGTTITSFFLSSGANQFDLAAYFDYNKDYLSYPLTDEESSIYLTTTLSDTIDTSGKINASITWEEQ
jgi:hypothetical protein